MGSRDFATLPHIGESVLRKEDMRFLTGAGQYTDDLQLTRASAPSTRAQRSHPPA
jgi:carbon-monoxide dehydrogenase large subunit